MTHFVYILASRLHGAIYIGATRDLRNRVVQHRSNAVPGHTRKYDIKTFVWFEQHEIMAEALLREKQIKRWRRAWKDELIENTNPDWCDVSVDIPL